MKGLVDYTFKCRGFEFKTELQADISECMWEMFEIERLRKKINNLDCVDYIKFKIIFEHMNRISPYEAIKIINYLDFYGFYLLSEEVPNDGTEWLKTRLGYIDNNFTYDVIF